MAAEKLKQLEMEDAIVLERDNLAHDLMMQQPGLSPQIASLRALRMMLCRELETAQIGQGG